jgi:hypothetical protein
MQRTKRPLASLLLLGLVACSPTFDWREFEPAGSGLRVSFPCRPDRHARSVAVAGVATPMEMLVCSTGGATFAIAFASLADPAAVQVALSDWRAAAVANLDGKEPRPLPLRLAGAPAGAQADMLVLQGRRPDGTSVRQQAAFFSKGLRAYQASVIGSELPAEATDLFFSGLKVLP